MKVVYMGTPDFAVPALKKISEAGHEVLGVFTQPDRPKGRSNKLIPSPVKVAAEELGYEVYQPLKLREEEYVNILRDLAPDIIVVAAYGQILTEDILELPKYGCINIHASLLPKFRGASPIEAAILSGDEKTGVTIMYMAKGLDTGDIISQADIEIGKHNTETLTEALSLLGADLVVKTIAEIEEGTASRTVQDDSLSTYSGKLSKEMGLIDFTESAEEIERKIRAFYPWPCAYTSLDGKGLKIIEADVVEMPEVDVELCKPGSIVELTKKSFSIATGDKALKIKKLQPEGEKAMDTVAFLNGNKLNVGDVVG